MIGAKEEAKGRRLTLVNRGGAYELELRLINLCVLGSTSGGNCTLLWDEQAAVMIDCGFSPRYVKPELEKIGLSLDLVRAVLITHAHGDHVRNALVRKVVEAGTPVFCHSQTRNQLIQQYESVEYADCLSLLHCFDGDAFCVGPFTVQSFGVPHDARGGCVGFTLFGKTSAGTKKITISTDLGEANSCLAERFADSDVMVIESNHDLAMLEHSFRPQWLKQRIRRAHLSNDECAAFLVDVIGKSEQLPQAVVVAHISQECNSNDLALGRTREALALTRANQIQIVETHPRQASSIVRVD